MRINNKEYLIKVYRPGDIENQGAFIATITDFHWDSFKKQINGGLGSFSFKIPKKFDDFGQGDLIDHNNQVEMYCIDRDSGPDGVLVYSGWIYAFQTSIRGQTESVVVTCYGYATKLSTSILRTSEPPTYVILYTTGGSSGALASSGPAAAADVEDIVSSIIDDYSGEASSAQVGYAAGTIEATGKTMTYTFDKVTWADAINACLKFAPANWYWYVDESNIFYFKAKPTAAIHTFTLGRDFQEVDIFNNADSIVNHLLFQDSHPSLTILKLYYDSTSRNKYDDRWALITNNSISAQATADNFGASYLAENKDPLKRTEVTIIDNNLDPEIGYNIEALVPGQTCQFLGFNPVTAQNFNDNMMIVAIEYSADSAKLTLEQKQDYGSKQILDAAQAAQQATDSNALGSYTT